MKNLVVRSLVGILFVAIMVAGILFSKYTFLLVLLVVLIGSLNEFYNITASKREQPTTALAGKWFLITLFTLVYLLAFFLNTEPAGGALPDPHHPLQALGRLLLMQRDANLGMNAVLPALFFLLFVIELFNKAEKPFANIGWNLVAAVYILMPIMLTTKLYFDGNRHFADKGGIFLVSIFAIIWFYDSACYAVGSVLGRTYLFKRISPKKTVEGLAGGAIITLVAVFFVVRIPALHLIRIPDTDIGFFHTKEWLVLAFTIIFWGTFGDLVESLLKRSLDIKDSGSIMPGHGGFLDRFDAYILTVPFVALTLWFIFQLENVLSLMSYAN